MRRDGVTGPPKWPLAVRAAISTTIPVVVGWAVGDLGAGLIATIGAFTARYGVGRPYLNRSLQLAVVAVSLALAVGLGAWAAQIPWVGVATVSAVAVAAVWLCNAFAVGAPGAYVFVVACAAGVGISASHLSPARIGLLVLSGGVVAWIVQMVGATTGFRRPERTAVATAANAVADFIDAAGTPEQDRARHRAATALHDAWGTLVSDQPVDAAAGSVLDRVRTANHAIHVAFADAISAIENASAPPESAEDVRRLGTLETAGEPVATSNRLRLRRPPASSRLRQAIAPGSQTRHVMLRVAIGVPLAGAAAVALGMDRAYWAMAASVLVLHQGANLVHTVRKSVERLLGTWIGLGLAAVILVAHPKGLLLALILALLQFTIQMVVSRNYTLATIFITATALTISSGSHDVDVGHLLLSRGIDTLIGCGVGLAVYLVLARRQEANRLSDAIARTNGAIDATRAYLSRKDGTTLAARTSRRDLQRATFDMLDAHAAAEDGPSAQRAAATRLWPDVVSTEGNAYAVIAALWALERAGATS